MNDQLTSFFAPVSGFFAKHHSVVFASALVLLLAVSIYALYDVTTKATAPVSNSGRKGCSQDADLRRGMR